VSPLGPASLLYMAFPPYLTSLQFVHLHIHLYTYTHIYIHSIGIPQFALQLHSIFRCQFCLYLNTLVLISRPFRLSQEKLVYFSLSFNFHYQRLRIHEIMYITFSYKSVSTSCTLLSLSQDNRDTAPEQDAYQVAFL
jgi:hypothetical protein